MSKLVLFCLLLMPLGARCDFIIAVNTQSPPEQNGHDSTIKIRGDKVRLDTGEDKVGAHLPGKVILLVNTRSHDEILIWNKVYVKTSGTYREYDREQMNKEMRDFEASGGLKIVDTGRKEKVGNYSAEIYTAAAHHIKFTVWISKEVPHYTLLQKQLLKLQFMLGEMLDTSSIAGVQVKSQMVKNGNVQTMILLSAKQTDIESSEFQIPSDSREAQPRLNTR